MNRAFPLVLAAWCVWQAHAQGTFTFGNRVLSAGLDQPILDTGGAARVTGPNFVAAVFLNGVQLGAAAAFRTGLAGGYWNSDAREVPGYFSGDTVNGFTVEVWDSTKGATARAACAAGGAAASSTPFRITLGGPKKDSTQPPDVPGVMLHFQGFNLFPSICPEPSIMALGALGAFFRATKSRRKWRQTSGLGLSRPACLRRMKHFNARNRAPTSSILRDRRQQFTTLSKLIHKKRNTAARLIAQIDRHCSTSDFPNSTPPPFLGLTYFRDRREYPAHEQRP